MDADWEMNVLCILWLIIENGGSWQEPGSGDRCQLLKFLQQAGREVLVSFCYYKDYQRQST